MSLKHSDEFKRDAVRIALTSGLTRRQVASDLSIGLSTLGKWIASISDETKIPTQDTDLLRENERLRGARRIRKKSYAKVFRASVRAETSRL
ncbi:transposase, partial [Escherichia coli]|uniref:transposase n=2 Tax=Escherichia coli TaxID=562 RepID=UPI00226EC815